LSDREGNTAMTSFSRGTFLLGALAVPFGRHARRAAIEGHRVVASTGPEVGWFDSVLRAPIAGTPRLSIDGQFAIALDASSRLLLLRSYVEKPFQLSIVATDSFDVISTFPEPAATVKGGIVRWPAPDHLLVVDGDRGVLVDPTTGRVQRQRAWPLGPKHRRLASPWRDGAAVLGWDTRGRGMLLFVDSASRIVAAPSVLVDVSKDEQPALAEFAGGIVVFDAGGVAIVHPDARKPTRIAPMGLPRPPRGQRRFFNVTEALPGTLLLDATYGSHWRTVLLTPPAHRARSIATAPIASIGLGLFAALQPDGSITIVDPSGRSQTRVSAGAPLQLAGTTGTTLLLATAKTPQERVAVDLQSFTEVARSTFAERAPEVVPSALAR
jgi:hypothetical protein